MREVLAGLARSRAVALLAELEEAKPTPRLRQLFELLADAGLFQRRGDRYRRADWAPPPEANAVAEAVARVVDEVALPHHLWGHQARRLTPELQRAIHAYTSIYQGLRIAFASGLEFGGLTLVAGWFPCGFSSELMSIAGRDVVIVEAREDVVAVEVDRLSLIPSAPSAVEQGLAAASFYSFEYMPPAQVGQLAEKYGRFDAAIACNRQVPLEELAKVADRVYVIYLSTPLQRFVEGAAMRALGLGDLPAAEDLERAARRLGARREELEGAVVYSLQSAR